MSLDIERARIYGFLGPNGSGKSTTIRMFCGVLTPTSGTVRVLGYDIPRRAEAVRTKIGYMTQKFSLWDDLTVLENLRFIARIYTLDKARAEKRIGEVLEEFKLRDLTDRPAAAMSGGQRQHLALAAATLHEPEMLMLDEPTSAVDPQSRRVGLRGAPLADLSAPLLKLTAFLVVAVTIAAARFRKRLG